MKIEEMINKTNEVTNEYNEGYMNIHYILQRSPTSFKAFVTSKEDPDVAFEVLINKSAEGFFRVFEWDYNIQDYLFNDLEKDYSIAFMPIETHIGIWKTVDKIRKEIYMKNGLQEYLSYCQKNRITSDIINLNQTENIDITNLYKEVNQKYQIIKSVTIDENVIVLGKKNKGPSPYVTWETSDTRKYGYLNGHYFSNYNDAFSDFKSRSNELLNNRLDQLSLNCVQEYDEKKEKNEHLK